MKTVITYVTNDGKQFDNQFNAKKHECELVSHDWEFFNENMVPQKAQDEKTHILFCKKCWTQKLIK